MPHQQELAGNDPPSPPMRVAAIWPASFIIHVRPFGAALRRVLREELAAAGPARLEEDFLSVALNSRRRPQEKKMGLWRHLDAHDG